MSRSPEKKSPKLSRRQAAQVILVEVMKVLPEVEPGQQAAVVDDVTGELLRLPFVGKKKEAKGA